MRPVLSVRKPAGYRPILNIDQNAKTVKGRKKRYATGVVYLAPADSSGVMNVCSKAGLCKGPCLNKAGRGAFTKTQESRIRKTVFLFEQKRNHAAVN